MKRLIFFAVNCLVVFSCTPSSSPSKDRQDILRSQLKNAIFCGGIAGIKCGLKQQCVDDPRDECDPTNGGADCSGVCVDAQGNQPILCEGIAGLKCPNDHVCIDDPRDGCDPYAHGADCGGVCVAESTVQ